jgi:alpha-tubulin suppressor-like RCC1 family protein
VKGPRMKKLLSLVLLALAICLPQVASAACCDPDPSYEVNTSNQFVLKSGASGAASVDFYWDGALLSHDTSAPFETTVAMSNGHVFAVTATWSPGGAFSETYQSPVMPVIASGDQTSCAQVAGKLYCWGKGTPYCNAALSTPSGCVDASVPTIVPFIGWPVRSLTMAEDGGCAIVNAVYANGTNGDVSCWGKNDNGIVGYSPASFTYSTPHMLTNGGGWVQEATGSDFVCALSTAGGVKCAGAGALGQIGNGANTATNTALVTTYASGVTKIAAGGDTACALKTTGRVECWGRDNRGQVGNGGSAVTYVNTPADVGLGSIVDIAVGYRHACALDSSHSVYCWGDNQFGELGNGNSDASVHVSPVFASQFSGVASLASGRNYNTCVITTAGSMKCVGENGFGQLGNGVTSTFETAATQVSGFTSGVFSIGIGGYNGCAFRNGHVYFWGDNTYNQIGNASATNPQLSPLLATGL